MIPFRFAAFFSKFLTKRADPLPKLDPDLIRGLDIEKAPLGPQATPEAADVIAQGWRQYDRETAEAYALRDAEPEPKSYVCGARPKLHGVGR